MLLGDIIDIFPEEVMFDEGEVCTSRQSGRRELGKGASLYKCKNHWERMTHLRTFMSSM